MGCSSNGACPQTVSGQYLALSTGCLYQARFRELMSCECQLNLPPLGRVGRFPATGRGPFRLSMNLLGGFNEVFPGLTIEHCVIIRAPEVTGLQHSPPAVIVLVDFFAAAFPVFHGPYPFSPAIISAGRRSPADAPEGVSAYCTLKVTL